MSDTLGWRSPCKSAVSLLLVSSEPGAQVNRSHFPKGLESKNLKECVKCQICMLFTYHILGIRGIYHPCVFCHRPKHFGGGVSKALSPCDCV